MWLFFISWFLVNGIFSLKPFNIRDMHSMVRVGSSVVSRDEKYAAYTVRQWNKVSDEKSISIDIVDIDAQMVAHTTPPVLGQYDDSPCFGPESSSLAFLRDGQVWVSDLGGRNPFQLSKFPPYLELGVLKWSPQGNYLVLSINVFEDCSDLQCTSTRNKAFNDYGSNNYYMYEQLFVRHWNVYDVEKKNSHLFILPVSNSGGTWHVTQDPIDIMKGSNSKSPIPPFGGAEEYDISADDTKIAWAAKLETKDAAWTCNWKVYYVTISSSFVVSSPIMISKTDARTQDPSFSPDGKYILFSAMDRPLMESDRLHIVRHEISTKKQVNLAYNFDRTITGPKIWVRNGSENYLLVSTFNKFDFELFAINIDDPTYPVTSLVSDGYVGDVTFLSLSNRLFWSRHTLQKTKNFYIGELRFQGRQKKKNSPIVSNIKQVTTYNEKAVSELYMSKIEFFQYESEGDMVNGLFLYPYNFDPSKKWPLTTLIHGGPEEPWMNFWNFRWQPQLWASAGFVTVLINFHGSPGQGQNFTDAILGDWGGKPYHDILNGLDYLIGKYPWIDSTKQSACGASYGGFMINWIQVNTERFQSLVVHDGVWDVSSFFYSTDEIWFPTAEMGGFMTQYENPAAYEKFNPRRLAKNAKTPMLVVHGGADYRIPMAQGLGAFTNLQRQGIDSKSLIFPEECHFVLRERNSIKWYDTVIDWITKYSK